MMTTAPTLRRPSTGSSPKETVMAFYDAFDRGVLRSFDGIGAPFEARVFGATVLDWPGFLAFGEIPSVLVFVGAAIIAGAGLFVIWRERRLGLQRPVARSE